MVDHATLPAVPDARLPESYERAKTALAECQNIDECQAWADKAEALASYAKQADDDSLRKMADRIQARAIRRAGELLKQIEPAKNQHVANARDGTGPRTRHEAATDAGLSERQRKTALRVANVPEQDFTEQVESDAPPTVTKLAEQGKRKPVDLKGRDPSEFNKALHFIAAFERHLKKCREYDIGKVVASLNDDERKRLRSIIDKVDAIHDQIMTRI